MLKHLEFVFDFDTWRHFFAIGNKYMTFVSEFVAFSRLLVISQMTVFQQEIWFGEKEASTN